MADARSRSGACKRFNPRYMCCNQIDWQTHTQEMATARGGKGEGDKNESEGWPKSEFLP